MILKLQDVTKTFIQGNTSIDALKEVTLKIKKNSFNIITGPSGSGKSTLISLSSLMDVPTRGEILINGIYSSQLSNQEKSQLRRDEIGIIYQRENLFPFLNILENVTVPQNSKNKENTLDILNKTDLTDIDKFPAGISLFDQQKVALARALVNDPSILLADEPTGELNLKETDEYINLIKEFSGKRAILMVSNNPDLRDYFDDVFYLSEGMLKKE